jgi:hypothetical protein
VKFFFACILLILSTYNPAIAKIVDSGLSKDLLVRDFNFKGAVITVSGMLDSPSDMLINVYGPTETFKVTKKERKFGLWLTGERHIFNKVPSILYQSTNFSEEKLDVTNNVIFPLKGICRYEEGEKNSSSHQSCSGLVKSMISKNAFALRQNPIEMIGDKIFRLDLIIPNFAPAGTYRIDVHSLSKDLQPSDTNTLYFQLLENNKIQLVQNIAKQSPLLYTIMAIFIALSIGLTTGLVFNRNK